MAQRDHGRPSLLYLSPVLPALTGNGLAMRAGAVLRALAERYRVCLLVLPLYASPRPGLPDELREACQQVRIMPSGISPGPIFESERFDVVHVFRLATLQVGRQYLDRAPERQLDLDDLESETRRRLAALYRLNGEQSLARREAAEAERAERLEAEVLRDFDRVYLCSERDRALLAGRGRAQVSVLPNAVPVQAPLPAAPPDGPFTFLFVGTLGYYPNEDAVRWFCGEVLPVLRRIAPRAFRLRVVGIGATERIRSLDRLPEVEVVGEVPELRPWYQAASAVVVPIRAGGGTRIKALEAFSYRRPVVTTSVGIEGIDAEHDRQVLVADTPSGFAEQCARLMADPLLSARLSESAFELVLSRYTPEAVARRLEWGGRRSFLSP